jgi:hypothetical protein
MQRRLNSSRCFAWGWLPAAFHRRVFVANARLNNLDFPLRPPHLNWGRALRLIQFTWWGSLQRVRRALIGQSVGGAILVLLAMVVAWKLTRRLRAKARAWMQKACLPAAAPHSASAG